jgi:hypothetical protein
MAKKSGKAGKAILPDAPEIAEDACIADPGGRTSMKGTGDSSSSSGGDQEEKVWISIELQDEEGNAVANVPYEIKAPNENAPQKAKLDGDGKAIIEGVASGTCQVCFPTVHGDEWKKVSEKRTKGG